MVDVQRLLLPLEWPPIPMTTTGKSQLEASAFKTLKKCYARKSFCGLEVASSDEIWGGGQAVKRIGHSLKLTRLFRTLSISPDN